MRRALSAFRRAAASPWIIVGFGSGGGLDIRAYAAGPGTPIPVQITAPDVAPPLSAHT